MMDVFFKIFFRSFKRFSGYVLLKVIALSVGLCFFVLIMLFVNYENKIDNWDSRLHSVYRISLDNGTDKSVQVTPGALAELVKSQFPGLINTVRIQTIPRGESDYLFSTGNKNIYQKNLLNVDTSFFSVFPYKLLYGNRKNIYPNQNSIAISEDLDKSLFGDANPIGKTVQINKDKFYTVTAVIQTNGYPSQIKFNALIPIKFNNPQSSSWNLGRFFTYISLVEPLNDKEHKKNLLRSVNANLAQIFQQKKTFEENIKISDLIAVSSIHLHFNGAHASESEFNFLIIASVLGILVLLASCINFLNLSIVAFGNRQKEIFVRRLIGSKANQLFFRFLFESFLHILLAIIIAILLVNVLLPYFSRIMNSQLELWDFYSFKTVLIQIIVILFLITLIAGGYPAILYSKATPVELIKENKSSWKKKIYGSKFLLFIQISVSILFISASIVLYAQLNYLIETDKGFNDDQIIKLNSKGFIYNNYQSFKNTLLTVPEIKNVSRASNIPGDRIPTTRLPFVIDGKEMTLNLLAIDFDFFETLQTNLKEGRYPNKKFETDSFSTAVLNESAVNEYNLKYPIGKSIRTVCSEDSPHNLKYIIGVIGNYNNEGFESKVKPTVYILNSGCTNYMASIIIKVSPDNIGTTLKKITGIWNQFEKDYPIQYTFLDEDFGNFVVEYTRIKKIVLISTLALLFVCLIGIFSISTFEANQRMRELSIRCVLGATTLKLVYVLNRKIVVLLIIASIVVLPISYFISNLWLNQFAYRITFPWHFYFFAIIAILVTCVIIMNQSIYKLLKKNKLKALRS